MFPRGRPRRRARPEETKTTTTPHKAKSPTAGQADEDLDFDNDRNNANGGLRDTDDAPVAGFGRPANASQQSTIVGLVERYLAAVHADAGASACTMIYSLIVESIPEDYGQAPGPAYARGSTCAVVMTKLFRHAHSPPASAVRVVGVRVWGHKGYALLASAAMPASYIAVKRERSVWKINNSSVRPCRSRERSASKTCNACREFQRNGAR